MKGPTPVRPPLRRIVSLLLRGSRGDVILGDLEEGYHRRLTGGASRAAAARWFITHSVRSVIAAARQPAREAALPPPRLRIRMARAGGDLRYALRSLWRRPGFTLPVVLTLALGIGVSATVFSVVEAVLIRQPAFRTPEQLVMVWNRQLQNTDSANLISGADFADLRTYTTTLSSVAALDEVIVAPVVGTDEPSFARHARVSANLFDVLGVQPILGRSFTDADQAPLPPGTASGPPRPLLLSHAYWVRMFGADSHVVGRRLRTFTTEGVIVGVLPRDFSLILPAAARVGDDLGAAMDIWETYPTDYTQWSRESRPLRVLARLSAGATIDDARAELDVIAARLRAEHVVHQRAVFALDAQPLLSGQSQHLRPLLLLLSAAVLCVLMVACVNASGVLLTRTVGRRDELAIRTALGAGRLSLARLVMLESLLLAVAGGALGLAVAAVGMELLAWLNPAGLPQAETLRLNRPVLSFGLLAAPGCAAVAGLVPALRALREGITLDTRGATTSRSRLRITEALVGVQIAATVLLLVGTALMVRSFWRLQQVPVGFDPAAVLTADISPVGPLLTSTDPTSVAEWFARRRSQERILGESLKRLPGVEAAGAVFPVPLNGVYVRTCAYSLEAEGVDREGVAYFRNVWPGYFESVRIPILSGRDFTFDDDQPGLVGWPPRDDTPRTDTPRVVIDERLATRLWPGERAVGRRLTFRIRPTVPHHAEVIGVVPFVPQGTIEDSMETIYIPRSYYRSQELTLTMRLGSDQASARRRVIDAVRRVFPESPVEFRPLDDYVHHAMAPTRFVLTLLGVFAGTALILASIGLYGSMAFMVRARTREIGVRIAMGAEPRSIGARVLGRAVGVGVAGVVVGLIAAGVLSRLLASSLYAIGPLDPAAFAVAALVQVAVGCLAGWIPARRAAAVDPTTALRE